MTTGKPTLNLEDIRLWAARVLGVHAEVEWAAVRTLLLEQLEQVDFVPAPEWDLACRVLRQPAETAAMPPVLLGPIEVDSEVRLRTRVEALAADFYAIDPGERRQRWQALQRSCAPFPRLKVRLDRMERGLDEPVGTPAGTSASTALLLRQLRELFICRPGERGAKMAEALAEWEDPAIALAAVAEVQKKYCATAALQPSLLDALLALHQEIKPVITPARPLMASKPEKTVWQATASAFREYPWLVIALIGVTFAAKVLFSTDSQRPSHFDPPRLGFNTAKWRPPDWSKLPSDGWHRVGPPPWMSAGSTGGRPPTENESLITEERAHSAAVLRERLLPENLELLQEEDWHRTTVCDNPDARLLDRVKQLLPRSNSSSMPSQPPKNHEPQ